MGHPRLSGLMASTVDGRDEPTTVRLSEFGCLGDPETTPGPLIRACPGHPRLPGGPHTPLEDVGGKGRCMDNIFIERLWRSLSMRRCTYTPMRALPKRRPGSGTGSAFLQRGAAAPESWLPHTAADLGSGMPVDMWTIGFADRLRLPASRASSKSGEVLAFAHIPTRTTVNRRIDQKGLTVE